MLLRVPSYRKRVYFMPGFGPQSRHRWAYALISVCAVSLLGVVVLLFGVDSAQPRPPRANPGQFPWMVAIYTKATPKYCTGTLIDERWVLTAASCVKGRNPSQMTVVLGTVDLDQPDPY